MPSTSTPSWTCDILGNPSFHIRLPHHTSIQPHLLRSLILPLYLHRNLLQCQALLSPLFPIVLPYPPLRSPPSTKPICSTTSLALRYPPPQPTNNPIMIPSVSTASLRLHRTPSKMISTAVSRQRESLTSPFTIPAQRISQSTVMQHWTLILGMITRIHRTSSTACSTCLVLHASAA